MDIFRLLIRISTLQIMTTAQNVKLPGGYAQWTTMNIINDSTTNTLQIQNAYLAWGKYYSNGNLLVVFIIHNLNADVHFSNFLIGDKDDELTLAQVDAIVIVPGASYSLGSCGREGTSSGCQGSYNIYDATAGVTAAIINFSSPWSEAYSNSFSIDCPSPKKWAVTQTGANLTSVGPLGAITVTAHQVSTKE